MSPWKSFALATIAGVLAVPALAQTEAISLSAMTVTRHETLRAIDPDVSMPCCAHQFYESGGDHDFVYIDADFAIAWSDELDRINISSSDILLQLPNETEGRRAWAHIQYFPQVELGSRSLNARRPRDWPEENAGAYLNMVFQVPAGATSAELLIGEGAAAMRIPITIPAETAELPSAAELFDIKVTNFTTMPELLTEDRMSREEIAGRITPVIGSLMRLDIEIQPGQNTRTDVDPGENQAFLQNRAFALVGPEGLPLSSMGRAVNSSVRTNYSTSAFWDDGETETVELTLFFMGSGAAGDYTLYFYDQPVGVANLQ